MKVLLGAVGVFALLFMLSVFAMPAQAGHECYQNPDGSWACTYHPDPPRCDPIDRSLGRCN